MTHALDIPTTPGAFCETHSRWGHDVIIVKFDQNLSRLIYCTYIGGNGNDGIASLAIDDMDRVCIAGGTSSSDFPVTNDAYMKDLEGDSDAYVLILSSDGSALDYSTLFGGSADDWFWEMRLDSNGDPFCVGPTTSSDVPCTVDAYCSTFKGGMDMMVVRFDLETKNVTHSTYFGGTGDEGNWIAMDLDEDDNFYVVGSTSSMDLPTTKGSYRETTTGTFTSFVIKMKANLSDIEWGWNTVPYCRWAL
jgi:hypothetical protein